MKNKRPLRAVFPGSFDPVTFGHIDIVRRFAPFFDLLTVLVSSSPHKQYMFSLSEREEMARAALKNISNTAVAGFSGLTADYARKTGASLILRGARSVGDFENEKSMARHNRRMGGSLETVLALARPEWEAVSGRFVKEIAAKGGNLSGLIPEEAARKIKIKAEKF